MPPFITYYKYNYFSYENDARNENNDYSFEFLLYL